MVGNNPEQYIQAQADGCYRENSRTNFEVLPTMADMIAYTPMPAQWEFMDYPRGESKIG